MKAYLLRIGDALSQLGNTIAGGHPNESISGRAYREQRAHRHLIDGFFAWFGDCNHCRESYMNDVKYAGKLLALHRTRNK